MSDLSIKETDLIMKNGYLKAKCLLSYYECFPNKFKFHQFESYLYPNYHCINIFCNFSDKTFEELVLDSQGNISSLYPFNRNWIQCGLYYKYILKWLKYFPMKQILIVNGDRLIKEPWISIAEIEQFLEIPNEVGRKENFFFNDTKGFYCPKQVTIKPKSFI